MSGLFPDASNRSREESSTNMITQAVYCLTPMSRILIGDTDNTGTHRAINLSPFVVAVTMHYQVNAAMHLAKWFGDETTPTRLEEKAPETPFIMANGTDVYGITSRDAKFSEIFNDGLGSDSMFAMALAVRECPEVFTGIGSSVDVGGGNGTAAKAIAEAFPHIECSVLDLPHVIDGMLADETVVFVAGDMMEYIPPVEAVLLNNVLHNWSDETCVKILSVCKKAICSRKTPGKVIIVNIVLRPPSDKMYEAQLLYDMAMVVFTTGKERNEDEWQKIFTEQDSTTTRYCQF
uniref:O-methyltransferase C-terminal domain-containing protein n=1 Tax=Oryza brachyantha TaxID=4533 RepID=J3LJH2_ORYBR